MIKKSDLKTGKAPEIVAQDGSVNVLLVLRVDDFYTERDDPNDNWYIPNWTVSNASYYNAHMDEFQGYIELEKVPIIK